MRVGVNSHVSALVEDSHKLFGVIEDVHADKEVSGSLLLLGQKFDELVRSLEEESKYEYHKKRVDLQLLVHRRTQCQSSRQARPIFGHPLYTCKCWSRLRDSGDRGPQCRSETRCPKGQTGGSWEFFHLRPQRSARPSMPVAFVLGLGSLRDRRQTMLSGGT